MRTVVFQTASGERRYLLHGADRIGPPRPLVLMLHGTGGSAEFAAEETGWAILADELGFLVAFPDGLPVNPAAPPAFLTNPKRWNDGSTRPGDRLHTTTDDVGFLSAVIAHVATLVPVDATRVYLSGFSNGAGMAFRFAAERPNELAAVAPLAGYCHVSPAAVRPPVPTLYLVGDEDKLIPLHGGQARLPWGNAVVERPAVADTLAKWATALGCDPSPHLVSDEDGVREERYPGPVEFTRVTVAGLGHHWPGGKAVFNPRIAGPPSDRVLGCRRVWEFFARHRR